MNTLQKNTSDLVQASVLPHSLLDDYIRFIDRGEKTTKTYITNLKQFFAWLRFAGIEHPCRDDITAYRQYLASEHDAIQLDENSPDGWRYRTNGTGLKYSVKCSANTVKQYLQSVRQFFKWASSKGLYQDIAANIHAPKVRQDTHKKDALTAAEVLAVENSILSATEGKKNLAEFSLKDSAGKCERATEQGKRLYAMYLLAVNCGLRTIELSRANISDFEMKNGTACLYVYGKGHSEADTRKPLAPEVAAAVTDYLSSRTDAKAPSSPLFVSTGNRSGGKRIASTTISKMLKSALKAAGFDSSRLTAHSLRHTAGTNAMELTGNIYLTQQYMRHASPATTEIYLHNDTEAAEASIAQRLYNHYHGKENAAGALEDVLQSLNAAQLEQLTNIAAAMAR